jgi:hypothetical protein
VSGRFIDIPRSVAAPYEIAAALATALAYPELDETGDRFFEVQAAFCGYHLRKVASQDPQWQWSPRVVVPGYLFLSEDEIASRLTGFPTRLAYRMIAAEIVIPFLKAFEAGEKPPRTVTDIIEGRRQDLKRLTRKYTLSDGVLLPHPDPDPENEESEMDIKNIRERIFRASLPVVHYAVALAVLIDRVQKKTGQVFDQNNPFLDPFFTHEDWILEVLREGNRYADLLAGIAKLRVDRPTQLRIRLISQ